MSAVLAQAMTINSSVSSSSPTESTSKSAVQTDVELIKCECCGLTEECTAAYISMICQKYEGKWICGLCAEAVNYEMRFLSIEDALVRHMSFCNQFKSAVPPPNPAVHLISAMTHILRRSLSPRKHVRWNRGTSEPVLSSLSHSHQMDLSEQARTEL